MVSFAVVLVLSAMKSVKILGYELHTTDMYATLTDAPLSSELPPVDTCSVQEVAVDVKPEFPAELDTMSKSILLVGDSMLEGLSPRLASYAKQNGHQLNTVIWYSSTSEVWGGCDTLSYFIREFNPDYIFVCLGANELFVKNVISRRAKYVEQIKSQIGDIPYLWIGPPNWKPDTGINNLLESKLPEGCFFKSDGMSFERSSDGAHPTRASAARWLDSVIRWMPLYASHPIKMEPPTGRFEKPDRLILLQPAQ
jgi:hypothetical protein